MYCQIYTHLIVIAPYIYKTKAHLFLRRFVIIPLAQCPVFGCRLWSKRGVRFYPLPHISVFALPLKAVAINPKSRICLLCWQRHLGRVSGLKGRVRIVPRLNASPIAVGTDAAPFVSRPAVVGDLYTRASLHRGLSHWTVHDAEFPLFAAEPLQPPYYSTLHTTEADIHFMFAVPFNLPAADQLKLGTLLAHYQQPSNAQVLLDVLRLMGEQSKRSDKVTRIVYQKDNESFSAWLAAGWDRWSIEEQLASAIHSSFNPHLFSRDPANLCCLMPDKDFGGFTSPSWYRKTPGTFFCLHVEQLFAPFYNLCYDGATTWWMVRREDRRRLDEYLVWRAVKWFGVKAELTVDEQQAVAGLLYSKQVVFHPEELTRAGVRLVEVRQTAGGVVVATATWCTSA